MLRHKKVRFWAFIPIFISLLIFGGMGYWGYLYLEPSVQSTQLWIDEHFSFLSWFGTATWILLSLVTIMGVAYVFVLVSALLACPFNAILAEAAEEYRTGKKIPGQPWTKVLKSLPGVLFQETKKVLYYLFWMIPVLILCLLLLPAAPFIWGAFSAWMMALEFTDYPMDNHGLKFQEMRTRLARQRMASFGFGSATFAFAMIPVLNVLTVPAAVCGATLLWLEKLNDVEVQGR